MKIVDDTSLILSKTKCHEIIKERNKFLIDYSLPRLTNTDIIPSSHLPINFIKSINTEVYDIVKKSIYPLIQVEYNENIDNLEINTVFFVENSYEYNRIYTNADKINYSYGFIILLNENTQYDGGELHINNSKINNDGNNIIIFDNHEKINFGDILGGEQYKIIGYVNNKLIKHKFNNNILLYNNPHVICINDIFEKEFCLTLYEIFNIKNKEALIKNEKISKLTENDTNIEFTIDGYQNMLELQKINDNLSNCKILNETLAKYDMQLKNMLSYKIEIIKKDKPSYYFSSIIHKNENGINTYFNNYESKFTLLINLNEVDGCITFIDTNKKIYFKEGEGILIPNNFLYKFYVSINNDNFGYFLIVTLF